MGSAQPLDTRRAVLVVRRAPAAVAAAVWSAVWAVVAATGQRFSTAYLDYGWQIIPWDTLTSDPVRSVWYLHVQPPLWNLVLGTLAWVSPLGDAVTLLVLQAVVGAALAAGCARLGVLLGLAPGPAVVVAAVATLHPEVLKNAFDPTYELVAAMLVVWTAVAIGRAVGDEGRGRWALGAVVVATALVLTRSLYHPVWLVTMLAVAMLAGARHHIPWRRALVLGLLPLVSIGGWAVKNHVLFERATLSSWFGMNLQRAVIPVLDADDLEAMFDAGQVSDVALVGPFGNFDLYAPFEPARSCTVTHDHPALSEPGRTTDPYSPNFNYECYLPVFDQAGADARAVIREHPEVWLEGRMWSARVMMAVSPMPAESESAVLRGLDAVYSLLRVDVTGVISTTGWGTPIYGSLEAPADFGLLPAAMYLIVSLAALGHLVTIVRRRRTTVYGAVVTVAGLTALWTFAVGVVGELGEQARFRTMTDALVWVTALAIVMRRLGACQSQAASPGP